MKPSDSAANPTEDAPLAKDEFEQVVEQLKSASSILVTVSTDPTVDQFAACIGLTLVLNKLGKHANAVFSGKAPSTIDFLKPEKTLEKDTDSLRDFIIALDKAKADKLRYKVEDDVVKIFITPYKTSIDEKDLEFSQGDFNVDVIVALGVQDKSHIDKAILAHGRILHDAAVVSINLDKKSRIGSINWADNRASSLCEMVADVAMELDNKIFDEQNATALLTGIVAETDRYSNEKAAPHTMSVAGLLMSAGASTQLVSTKLEEGAKVQPTITSSEEPAEENGVLEIDHNKAEEEPAEEPIEETSESENSSIKPLSEEDAQAILDQYSEIDDSSKEEPDKEVKKEEAKEESPEAGKPKIIRRPPEFSGKLTANSESEDKQYSGSTDPLSNLPETPLLSHDDDNDVSSPDTLIPASDEASAKPALPNIDDNQTLSQIEHAVDSPHLDEEGTVVGSTAPDSSQPASEDSGLDVVRDAVLQAEGAAEADNPRPQAREDIGTTDLSRDLHPDEATPPESATLDPNISKEDTPPPPVPPPYLPPEA